MNNIKVETSKMNKIDIKLLKSPQRINSCKARLVVRPVKDPDTWISVCPGSSQMLTTAMFTTLA